ncbi:MAG: FG-GAP-like repeat-containing protein [Elainella sp. Prado103]|jgi:Ca2+-binding RTX toxin-like protein|nr:FG-GAP-like repeat-containing protein [Elainella sp. Prado103]
MPLVQSTAQAQQTPAQLSRLSRLSRSTRDADDDDVDIFNPAGFGGTVATLPIGAASTALTTGDFNGDGNADLVVSLGSSAIQNNLTVFLGAGNGSFRETQELSSDGLTAVSPITGDFNQDGLVDLVTANFGSDTVSLLLGTGAGTFQPPQTFRVGSQPNAVAAADLNQDGRLDLVTANSGRNTNTLSILLGESGGFRNQTTLKVKGSQPFSVATGDFNRDGNLDIVSAETISGSVSLFLGRGNGEFRDPEQFFVGGATPVSIVTGDFDGDQKLDIATGNLGSNGRDISVLFGDGKGDFPDGKTIPAGGGIQALLTGDFNGDGNLDFAGTRTDASVVAIVFGNGKGDFTRSNSPFVTNSPAGLGTADFNRDGKPDFVTTSSGENAAVLLNRTSFVVLRSTQQKGEVDGSQEQGASMTVDLDQGSLVVNSNPIVRVPIDGFNDVQGTQVKDKITGNDRNNRLSGNKGQDQLIGLGGNDTLTGGDGKDRLTGGDGNDKLSGGLASDQLTGGRGNDRFIFDYGRPFVSTDQPDSIKDFEKGADKIGLDRGTFKALKGSISFESVSNQTAAARSDALITYVRSNGRLYYNENGAATGFGSGNWFATIEKPQSTNGNLSRSDFQIQS